MNQMESSTPLHEWVEALKPGDLIRVSYGSRTHYMGAFKQRKTNANGWIVQYWDLPHAFTKESKSAWIKKLEEDGKPLRMSYIYGYSVKDRIHPAKEWMLTNYQRKYYKLLLKTLK
jgi:hypothetical protein